MVGTSDLGSWTGHWGYERWYDQHYRFPLLFWVHDSGLLCKKQQPRILVYQGWSTFSQVQKGGLTENPCSKGLAKQKIIGGFPNYCFITLWLFDVLMEITWNHHVFRGESSIIYEWAILPMACHGAPNLVIAEKMEDTPYHKGKLELRLKKIEQISGKNLVIAGFRYFSCSTISTIETSLKFPKQCGHTWGSYGQG